MWIFMFVSSMAARTCEEKVKMIHPFSAYDLSHVPFAGHSCYGAMYDDSAILCLSCTDIEFEFGVLW